MYIYILTSYPVVSIDILEDNGKWIWIVSIVIFYAC